MAGGAPPAPRPDRRAPRPGRPGSPAPWRPGWSAPALALLLAAGAVHGQVRFGAGQLALVVNDADPNSVAIAALYRAAHHVPADNVVHVRLPGAPARLEPAQFAALKADIDRQLPPGIAAVLMVWTTPYAVACNGITAAYTLGLDPALCAHSCGAARPNPLFNSPRPLAPGGLRLSMLLPTDAVDQARALIARGSASAPPGPAGAYFATTAEQARNSRAFLFPPAGRVRARKLDIHRLFGPLTGARDVLVYETGSARVAGLDTIGFLPGALADHLTSFGGDLRGTGQMSALRWLEAGATATYGTVSEPCNYWQKFPHPTVLLQHYLAGETALAAYWKSVAWPAQGVFLGDPLAAPYAAAGRPH